MVLEQHGKRKRNSTTRTDWHSGFHASEELLFREDRDCLQFQPEVMLGKEPPRLDLLIIKKDTDRKLRNEIGSIFRKYNIQEYKSPGDALSIDDFYKTIGYACFYKALQDGTNTIPGDEITVTLIREAYPRELMKELQRLGFEIEEDSPGILRLKGNTLFPAQIIVTGKLEGDEYLWLRGLTNNLTETLLGELVESSSTLDKQDKDNAIVVLKRVSQANRSVTERYRQEELDMKKYDLMELLFTDKMEEMEKQVQDKENEVRAKDSEIRSLRDIIHRLGGDPDALLKASGSAK